MHTPFRAKPRVFQMSSTATPVFLTRSGVQYTCTTHSWLGLADSPSLSPASRFTSAVSVEDCKSGRRAALHADKPGQGEAAVPVYAPIHHRYGNYHSVVCEADPHLASKTGSPGDTDYKTLQWRLSLLRAGLSFSPPVNWGGRWWWWWLTSIDEKSFSGRHLGPLLDLHLYTLNEDHACHVCIRSGEYIPFQFTSVHVFLSF